MPGKRGQMEVSLNVEGEARARRELQQLLDLNREGAVRAVSGTAAAIHANAVRRVQQQGAVDRGELIKKLQWKPTGGGLYAKVQADALHSAVVELGRKPGSRMPPAEAIAGWMARVGIDPLHLFAIRRKIGEDGIEPRPFLLPAFEQEKDTLKQRISTELKRATREADQ